MSKDVLEFDQNPKDKKAIKKMHLCLTIEGNTEPELECDLESIVLAGVHWEGVEKRSFSTCVGMASAVAGMFDEDHTRPIREQLLKSLILMNHH